MFAVVFVPTATDPRRYAVSGDDHGMVRVWDVEEAKQVNSLQLPAGISSAAVSPDANVVALGDSTGRIYLLQLEGFQEYAARPPTSTGFPPGHLTELASTVDDAASHV